MMRFWLGLGYLLLLTIIFVLVYMLSLSWPPRESELANKREWSVLQSIQSHNRDREIRGVMAERNYGSSEFDLIGLPASDGTVHWVLGNAQNIPRIKILPKFVQFRISEDDYKTILSTVRVNEEVNILLRNSIETGSR